MKLSKNYDLESESVPMQESVWNLHSRNLSSHSLHKKSIKPLGAFQGCLQLKYLTIIWSQFILGDIVTTCDFVHV